MQASSTRPPRPPRPPRRRLRPCRLTAAGSSRPRRVAELEDRALTRVGDAVRHRHLDCDPAPAAWAEPELPAGRLPNREVARSWRATGLRRGDDPDADPSDHQVTVRPI